jgi:hypothetical protein
MATLQVIRCQAEQPPAAVGYELHPQPKPDIVVVIDPTAPNWLGRVECRLERSWLRAKWRRKELIHTVVDGVSYLWPPDAGPIPDR